MARFTDGVISGSGALRRAADRYSFGLAPCLWTGSGKVLKCTGNAYLRVPLLGMPRAVRVITPHEGGLRKGQLPQMRGACAACHFALCLSFQRRYWLHCSAGWLLLWELHLKFLRRMQRIGPSPVPTRPQAFETILRSTVSLTVQSWVDIIHG